MIKRIKEEAARYVRAVLDGNDECVKLHKVEALDFIGFLTSGEKRQFRGEVYRLLAEDNTNRR